MGKRFHRGRGLKSPRYELFSCSRFGGLDPMSTVPRCGFRNLKRGRDFKSREMIQPDASPGGGAIQPYLGQCNCKSSTVKEHSFKVQL
jgi:hypothetical protein